MARALPLFIAMIPTDSILVSSTNVLNYVSESIRTITIRDLVGHTVSRFSQLRPSTVNNTHEIVIGDFNPGVQPHGTPISAEVVHGGDVEMNVMWRDAHGRPASSSWSKSSSWDLPKPPNDASHLLDGPARSVYIALIYNTPNTK